MSLQIQSYSNDAGHSIMNKLIEEFFVKKQAVTWMDDAYGTIPSPSENVGIHPSTQCKE